jgi:hypothetical protein
MRRLTPNDKKEQKPVDAADNLRDESNQSGSDRGAFYEARVILLKRLQWIVVCQDGIVGGP